MAKRGDLHYRDFLRNVIKFTQKLNVGVSCEDKVKSMTNEKKSKEIQYNLPTTAILGNK